MLLTMNQSITFAIIFVILLLLFILYIYITRRLSYSAVKMYLTECIGSLGNELVNSLVESNDLNFNKNLIIYLRTKDTKTYDFLIDHLFSKYSLSKYSSLTHPAIVMRALLQEIISEQLNAKYEKGFFFSQDTFDNIKTNAPFLARYCLIAKMKDDLYFTDILKFYPNANINQVVRMSYNNFIEIVSIDKEIHYENLFFPEKLVILADRSINKYIFNFNCLSDFNFILHDGNTFTIRSLILKKINFFSSSYKMIGGNRIGTFDLDIIKYDHSVMSKSFLSVLVCEKINHDH